MPPTIENTDPWPDLPWIHVPRAVAKDCTEYPRALFFLRVVDWRWDRTLVLWGDPWVIDTRTEWYRAGLAAWLAGAPEIAMEIVCGDDLDRICDALRKVNCGCGG